MPSRLEEVVARIASLGLETLHAQIRPARLFGGPGRSAILDLALLHLRGVSLDDVLTEAENHFQKLMPEERVSCHGCDGHGNTLGVDLGPGGIPPAFTCKTCFGKGILKKTDEACYVCLDMEGVSDSCLSCQMSGKRLVNIR